MIAWFGFLTALAWADPAPPPRGLSRCAAHPSECGWNHDVGQPKERNPSASNTAASADSKSKKTSVKVAKPVAIEMPGNLPAYQTANARAATEASDEIVIVAEKPLGALLPGLRAGDILQAEIEQSIKASPSVPTPVRARVTQGRFRGAFVLGSATFDRELKRVLLVFEHMRLPGNETTYALKATGLAASGQVGLEGDYHTQEGLFFAAEILTAGAAGYADATTQRNQTLLGTYQTAPTLANASKQGAVTALSKSAERFAERERTAPEYTEIEGGREIQIILEASPTESTGT